MKYKCIIFDCDGVLVDSEIISAKVFMKMAEELGFKMSLNTAIKKFAGTAMKENLRFIEENIDGDLPSGFEKEFRRKTYEIFKTELKPVEGVVELVNQITVPYCVASSGPVEKIKLNLSVTGLLTNFENKIFSSYEIGSWKPEPEIYLHASEKMGFKPSDCVVIEDSEAGIKSALAGGFDVYARATDDTKKIVFKELGATVFTSMEELGEKLEVSSYLSI